MATLAPIPHILAADDVLPAQGVQATADEADNIVDVFAEQHQEHGDAGWHDSAQVPVGRCTIHLPVGWLPDRWKGDNAPRLAPGIPHPGFMTYNAGRPILEAAAGDRGKGYIRLSTETPVVSATCFATFSGVVPGPDTYQIWSMLNCCAPFAILYSGATIDVHLSIMAMDHETVRTQAAKLKEITVLIFRDRAKVIP